MLPNMAFMLMVALACIFSLCPIMAEESIESASDKLDTYIVHLNAPTDKPNDLESWYNTFLPNTATSLDKKQHIVHSYRHVATGFAAKLSPEDAKDMEQKDGVVSVRPQSVFSLHTTRTPRFLGLHQNLGFWKGSNYGKGIIIGLLDTGITPGHPSFSDKGMPLPPAKWKGKCDNGTVCSKKLIGARNFIVGETGPPLDDEGHGTHTASTAAGNFVKDANVFGMAFGTAVGMAPLAHVAMYKVCDGSGCFESDILAGMDAAIDDGVDVLSLSLGGISLPFFEDGIAVGAFKAIQKGIFVSCSAGNSGPYNASLSNEAPWILTVGASIIDRTIRAAVLLGNKAFMDGESLFQPKDFPRTMIPLVYPGSNGDQATQWCAEGSLKSSDVKGKIVLCQRGGGIARIAKGQAVKDAGGAAMILMNAQIDGDSTLADAHVLPATHVGYDVGSIVLAYINSTSSPVATIIFKGTISEGVDWAPQMTSFSSRGPNSASPGILKPDITGPGVSILAAWPFSVDNNTKSTGPFNVISGTSMSCPHLGGIAALLKSAHPDWTPAAIKSAIMTTALLVSRDKQPIEDERDLPADLFAVGSGHVNPTKAADPGLVYDIHPDDYIPYLCGLGYTSHQITVITGKQVTCTNQTTISEAELNYPSFAIKLGSHDGPSFTRTVTNVGAANSSYTVEVLPPPGVVVTVGPSELNFSKVGQKLSYAVTFHKQTSAEETPYVEGSLTWKSGRHSVRSPISVHFV